MEMRMMKNPAFIHVGGLAGVGTFDEIHWFICTLQPHNPKTGKEYRGYYAFWQFKRLFSSKEEAIAACKKWLSTSLI